MMEGKEAAKKVVKNQPIIKQNVKKRMIGWSRWTLRHQNFLGKNLCLIPEKRADRQREKAIPEKMCGKNLRYGMPLYEEARKKDK